MRKTIFAAVVAGAALSLAACSSETTDTTSDALDSAMADAEANLDAAGTAIEDSVDEAGEAIDRIGDDTEEDFEDTPAEEAAAD